ncbi:Pls/PosA family non-ribosomal peptide synthetase [Brachybacterium aquaticum]|uniref:Non-ribosomal peptide synthetase-like protein n=1 Tax=Brachybacterium aquaticum TaxID=1432564 RepID=A0A841A5U3_9MICO|nr:Pls/PosA family non-ribosomal peptide synthetase [Brachybacterium aquaticum]MBB5830519.1 non-ribosomal peptide synthetase-like protein [Brachybacterium aquaticum]
MTAQHPALLPSLQAGDRAPTPSTLVEIFRGVVARHGDAPAVDAGAEVLSYAALEEAALEVAGRLAALGAGPGAKVGVRISSGTTDLYVAILGVLLAGAAYVPVDADDPDERARVVFEESAALAVIGDGLVITPTAAAPWAGIAPAPGAPSAGAPSADVPVEPGAPVTPRAPSPADDAWVIFTSGSTGKPKGVAVTHRNAAAFVEAESRMFLQDAPIAPGDRVMAGLSVAFDASCEEMWLAWAYGGCLVPAPRSLVRSGVDVGPWLEANRITIVSTVPTLVSLWPDSALTEVRLLIMGGEACPPELAARLQATGREVWNTYGPTEATVVACGAMLDGTPPVRIGLPLDGWDLAVVDAQGQPVGPGESGELIIGGVGLARYLDPAKDAEKYAPMPSLGWERAYRSGDIVVNDPDGLLFAGRADDQIKLGGRRIELGEIDDQLLRLPGVVGGATAVRSSKTGNKLLVGYLTVDDTYDAEIARGLLRQRMPAALVPRLAVVDDLPTRTSGKIDRDALPWPLPGSSERSADLSGTAAWIAEIWADVLGAEVTSGKDDFFDLGGGSLTAAQVVSRLREQHPELTVGDVYQQSTVAALAAHLDAMDSTAQRSTRTVAPLRRRTQIAQLLALVPLRTLAALRGISWLMLVSTVLAALTDVPWLVAFPLWLVIPMALVFILPPGRMTLAALLARILLRKVTPGSHPRGGSAHLRLWLAEHVQDELGATSLSGAVWFPYYARLLGVRLGKDVDLHSLPPVTGMLEIGAGASIEPEVDLAGYWIDGDVLRIGPVRIGKRARIGARSTLGPGARVGRDAEIAPGSAVLGKVPAGEFWSGSPAAYRAESRGPWSDDAPPRRPLWELAYGALSLLIAALPGLGVLVGGAVLIPAVRGTDTLGAAALAALPWLPLAALAGFAAVALAVLVLTRLLARAISPGHHPMRSAAGVSIWATLRLLDEARTWLFPLYAGGLTPVWMRMLGAKVGKGAEISTALLIPSLVQVGDHSFLADDTLVGPYELGGGWIRVERVKVGKRAFVGNSGMLAAGRKVPKQSLVAVLSAAPRRKSAKAGTSYLGSPPRKLRRAEEEHDDALTYDPPKKLLVQRGIVETLRLVPLLIALLLPVAVWGGLYALLVRGTAGIVLALVLGGAVLMLAGLLAAGITVVAKWAIIGRHRPGEHALFTAYVWRSELADTFTEVLAAPWFANVTAGTWALNVWLRALGAKVGEGVWCDSYWLPETDLVTLGDGATVNRGCVVQTHLFQDRVLSMDTVTLGAGATLGPGSVILPAAAIDRHATVGPVSLVMRGERVPPGTRWTGNPIGPWDDEDAAQDEQDEDVENDQDEQDEQERV